MYAAVAPHPPAGMPREQDKTDEDDEPAPTEALAQARVQCIAVAMAAGGAQRTEGMLTPPEDFVEGALKWGLMTVRSATCHAAPFRSVSVLVQDARCFAACCGGRNGLHAELRRDLASFGKLCVHMGM